MDLTPVTTPGFIKYVFPKFTWDVNSQEKVLYLTFDDGPTPEITDWTLDVLNEFDAKATFFCIGKNINDHPEIFHRILADGHSIGNHTYNHLKGWKTSLANYLANVEQTQQVIYKEAGVRDDHKEVKLFRPPYGRLLPGQARQLLKKDFKIIMWSVLAKDWDHSLPKEKCLENVINNAAKGDIIVFHDSIKAAKNLKYALPEVLAYFSRKGFKFRRIPG